MNQLLGIAVMIASAIVVYFLHVTVKAEVIPIILLLISVFFVALDYPRRYFYLIGLLFYPLITTINVAMTRSQSLYPIVIFYELSMIAMILFGTFLGVKVKRWIDVRRSD